LNILTGEDGHDVFGLNKCFDMLLGTLLISSNANNFEDSKTSFVLFSFGGERRINF
jgi:hypothetical protein